MHNIFQTALLVLLVALGIYIAMRLQKLRGRIGDLVAATARVENALKKAAKAASAPATVAKASDGWKQIDALLAVYRMLDGTAALPPTGGWAAAPDFIRILMTHIAEHQPMVILECGSGTTTVAMAYAAKSYGGRVYALENHNGIAAHLERDLHARGLADVVTIIRRDLSERTYPGFDHTFLWYDVQGDDLPPSADMLVVDGPRGDLNADARYPAGPELLKLLSRQAHIFLDDTERADEGNMPRLWRSLHPDLGVRHRKAEKGAMELFFLDAKIDEFRVRPKVTVS